MHSPRNHPYDTDEPRCCKLKMRQQGEKNASPLRSDRDGEALAKGGGAYFFQMVSRLPSHCTAFTLSASSGTITVVLTLSSWSSPSKLMRRSCLPA